LNPWILLGLIVIVGALGACYWGAGVILHPPLMSRLETFPEQYGLRYEKAVFKTRDGLTLKGWWIPSPEGESELRTLIMCHGWGDNKGELLKITHYLNEKAGFNLLYFDNRSHGESEGEVTTIGALETIDFDAAVNYLKENKPENVKRLGVFGMSMGAAVACMSVPDHPEVKAAVLESPFTDFRIVTRRWAWNNLYVPYFPLVPITMWFLRWKVSDPKVDTYSPIRFVAKIAPRPLLIVGGSADRLMTESDVRRLYAAAAEPKQLWIIPGAAHAKCHDVGGLEYEARVTSFFNKNL
jgi:alpha-beta hydrolase superfamily lysophospholipase